jgi:glycosyltransferase involved in cell wall biosynthesis
VESPPIVVFSHLRWNSVYQRPQQLLSRIAATRRVIFFEETAQADPLVPDSIELSYPLPNLIVARPILQDARLPFDPARLAALARRLVRWQHADRHIAWLYTPLAFELARALSPDLVVYDCMDELASFLDAPPALPKREAELLASADVVFAGGPSLYRAKRALHPRVYCFPSSVDVDHFRPASAVPAEPPDQSALTRPRLGFYGVLDERLDRDLLDGVAAARPDWEIVLIGPVAKIDPSSLPRRANLHYLGQRPYESLPDYLAGWDVCMLPFARNSATRFISPTKTLEYMAAEKPIVTTSIRDVVEPYQEVVEVADTPADFVAACERLLNETNAERTRRVARMRELVAATSWDGTVAAMLEAAREAARDRTLSAMQFERGPFEGLPAPAAS